MNDKIKTALEKLSRDDAKALELVRELNREVHHANFERSIFCSTGGVFYVGYEPENPTDLRVKRMPAIDLIPVGPEFADADDGYESFDDIPDDVWDSEVADLQDTASELASFLD